MSYPALFATPGLKTFAEAVDTERQRQLAKWGDQHHPDLDPRDIGAVTRHYYADRANIWREVNEERATPTTTPGRCAHHPDGPHTHTAWDGILLEEVYEALAESDPAALEAELVQCAAVIAAWIADLHSRRTAPARPSEPLCRCGHARDRHTPRGGDAWPAEECADCPRDEERPWANPQHHRYTPARDGDR